MAGSAPRLEQAIHDRWAGAPALPAPYGGSLNSVLNVSRVVTGDIREEFTNPPYACLKLIENQLIARTNEARLFQGTLQVEIYSESYDEGSNIKEFCGETFDNSDFSEPPICITLMRRGLDTFEELENGFYRFVILFEVQYQF